MRAVGVIPARYASTRFPGKSLALIAGSPMIQHVWENACTASSLSEVWVATDDERIAATCTSFGASVALTSPQHPTGTDRLAEVARSLDAEIVVNIQGDEPLIEGRVIDIAVQALIDDPDVPVATVVHAAGPEAGANPDRVKVVQDRNLRALYFSRSEIPAQRGEAPSPPFYQHVGLYAYRREFLLEFVKLPRTPAEQSEELEQLRVLEHGHPIRAAIIEDWESVPVDVPEDIQNVEARLAARKK